MVDQIVAFIGQPAVATVLIFVLEVVLRLVKTDKPLSILIIISGGLKGVIKVALAVDGLLDKVIPQKVTPPAA